MSRAADALMRLYENADLRDELTDEEADHMLKWAEAELTRMDAASPDDASFEAQADTLMDLLRKMNRFAGRQGQFSAQGVDPAPTNIAALASELGHPASPQQIAATGTGDPASTITALTALMSGALPAAQSVPTTETPAEAPATQAIAADVPPNPPITHPSPPAEEPTHLSGDPFDEIDL